MGNPLAPQVAIIYMHYVETKLLEDMPCIVAWYRYIDDIFLVWNKSGDGKIILDKANSINPHIKFTFEWPNQENKLSFLDMELYPDNNRFAYHLYIKPLHSGTTIHWSSNCPVSLKLNILRNEFIRAKRRSSSRYNTQFSYNLIRKRFISNGFPLKVVKQVFDKLLYNRQTNIVKDCPSTIKFLRFPYLDESFKRKAHDLLRRTKLKRNVKLWFDSGPPLHKILHRYLNFL